jgi:hypothetical protein
VRSPCCSPPAQACPPWTGQHASGLLSLVTASHQGRLRSEARACWKA